MKRYIFVCLLFAISSVFGQSDKIYKHTGETVLGKVIKLEEYTIVFQYDKEDAQNTIGKYAVEKIVYGKSGRTEVVSQKIIVAGEGDWQKVVILEDRSYIAGLKKREEIRGKTGFISFHTGNTADKKAEKKLKMDAAKNGYPFILLTLDKEINQTGASGPSFGNIQNIKKGIGFKY
jgi:hypothetical protein